MIKKLHFVFALALMALLSSDVTAQVDDVSIIVAPTGSYNWFDKNSTVQDGLMYGLQAGFGFGKVVELRGIYEQSANLGQDFKKYEADIQQIAPGFALKEGKVKVTRTGGEFKTNIPAKGFVPYLLLGTGVQKFERTIADDEKYKSNNLYLSGGLGIKINLDNRTTLNFEGRGIGFNMNPNSALYQEGGTSAFDGWVNDRKSTRMYNWGLNAALQFYLGGRDDDQLSDIDKAYLAKYSGGLSRTKLILAPVGAFVNFNKTSGYKNTYFLGGMLGVDFTNFVGLRAYYYQATDPDESSITFDKLGMYGVDFVGNLNVARGIVPYITVGGGYLNVGNGYVGKNSGTPTDPVFAETPSGYYAKGGAGLTIPLGRYLDVFGAANVFYTLSDQDVKITDLGSTNQLKQHTMMNAGLRLKLGKSARTSQVVNKAFYEQFDSERNAYQQKIEHLKTELRDAIDSNDTQRVIQIMDEKKKTEAGQKSPSDSLIRLTPAELESIIEKTVRAMNDTPDSTLQQKKIDSLELILRNLNQPQPVSNDQTNVTPQKTASPSAQEVEPDTRDTSNLLEQRLIDEINTLKVAIKQQNESIEALKESRNAATPNAEKPETGSDLATTPASGEKTASAENVHITAVAQNEVEKTLSIFVGPNFGTATTFDVGARLNYKIANTGFIFMPEAFVGIGKKLGFGLSANLIHPIRIKNPDFTPYAGLGVGISGFSGNVYFNPDFIVGTNYHLKSGDLFADYTVRGAFKNNQIAIGYQFNL